MRGNRAEDGAHGDNAHGDCGCAGRAAGIDNLAEHLDANAAAQGDNGHQAGKSDGGIASGLGQKLGQEGIGGASAAEDPRGDRQNNAHEAVVRCGGNVQHAQHVADA